MEQWNKVQQWYCQEAVKGCNVFQKMAELGLTVTFDDLLNREGDDLVVMSTAKVTYGEETIDACSFCRLREGFSEKEVIETARHRALCGLLGQVKLSPDEPIVRVDDGMDESDFIERIGKCHDLKQLNDMYQVATEKNCSEKVIEALNVRADTLKSTERKED